MMVIDSNQFQTALMSCFQYSKLRVCILGHYHYHEHNDDEDNQNQPDLWQPVANSDHHHHIIIIINLILEACTRATSDHHHDHQSDYIQPDLWQPVL